MGARAAALSLARLIPEQILTRPGHIFNLWPHSRGLQPQCGLQRARERERDTGSQGESVYPKPVQCKPLGRLGPVTHCPVSRCYETAVGARAVGRTGSRAAPSSFYGAPRTFRRLVVFPLFVQRNKLSVLRFTGGHGSSEQAGGIRAHASATSALERGASKETLWKDVIQLCICVSDSDLKHRSRLHKAWNQFEIKMIWSQSAERQVFKNDFALKTNIKRGLKSEIWINVSRGSGIKRLNRSERRQIYGIKKVWNKSKIKLLEFATTFIIYHQKSESKVRTASLNKRFLGLEKVQFFSS